MVTHDRDLSALSLEQLLALGEAIKAEVSRRRQRDFVDESLSPAVVAKLPIRLLESLMEADERAGRYRRLEPWEVAMHRIAAAELRRRGVTRWAAPQDAEQDGHRPF